MKLPINPTFAIACLVLAAAVPATVLAGGELPPPTDRAQRTMPTRAAGQKPGGTGVVGEFQLGAPPRPGQPTPVVLQFEGVTAPDGATVRLSPDPGLSLQGGTTLTLPPGSRSTATVLVVSEREGLAYLNLFVTQKGASSAISIPIQTGDSPPLLKSVGEQKATPDGERLIMLPAK